MDKLRVLFVCTGNACRSQMAEGWARALRGDEIEAHSAGVIAAGVSSRAARVMKEAGVDLSTHTSKTVREVARQKFDLVVTLCDHANEVCPVIPGAARRVHRGFDDPPTLADGARTEDEALAHFRRVRDEIKAFVAGLSFDTARTNTDRAK